MADDKKRIPFEEAQALYPDEWVVFSEPRSKEEDTTFIDGFVYFHSPDQHVAVEKAAEVAGDIALLYTGEPRYRNVTFEPLDAVHKPAA